MPEQISDILTPDKHNLDREWERQPKLLYKYDKRLADAVQEQDTAEAALDVIKAELFLKMRDDPSEFDLVKATEAALNAAIVLQPGYKNALRAVHNAKHKVGVVRGIVFALQQKKAALDNLVQLHFGEYYARKPKSGTVEKFDEMEKRMIRRRGKERR